MNSNEERLALMAAVREWRNNPMTKRFLRWLEADLEKLHELQDSKSVYTNEYEHNYEAATFKGKRVAYRNIIKQLED